MLCNSSTHTYTHTIEARARFLTHSPNEHHQIFMRHSLFKSFCYRLISTIHKIYTYDCLSFLFCISSSSSSPIFIFSVFFPSSFYSSICAVVSICCLFGSACGFSVLWHIAFFICLFACSFCLFVSLILVIMLLFVSFRVTTTLLLPVIC